MKPKNAVVILVIISLVSALFLIYLLKKNSDLSKQLKETNKTNIQKNIQPVEQPPADTMQQVKQALERLDNDPNQAPIEERRVNVKNAMDSLYNISQQEAQ